jgi:hypothetical protein
VASHSERDYSAQKQTDKHGYHCFSKKWLSLFLLKPGAYVGEQVHICLLLPPL